MTFFSAPLQGKQRTAPYGKTEITKLKSTQNLQPGVLAV
jgi:hypothetical protein